MERPSKDNSKKNSDPPNFKELLKQKCPRHPNNNHTTEQCFQLHRALKDTPEPIHPKDRKGKEKKDDKDYDDGFQDATRNVNVLFGGIPTKRSQKLILREIMSIEPATPTFLKWSEVPITFSREDQWTSFSEPGRFQLVLDLVVAGSRLTRVLIDGDSGLNVLFTKTLKKMGLDVANMLIKTNSPFYGIVPGNAAVPLG